MTLGRPRWHVHVDVELLHEVVPLLSCLLQEIIMADVADQDEVIYVFEEDLDSIDPIFCIVETEKYVSWMNRRIPIRERMITTKSRDKK